MDESLGCSNFHGRIKLRNERGNTLSCAEHTQTIRGASVIDTGTVRGAYVA